VPQTQNVAQTALEAGNSPKIIFSNYRELVKPADAVKWFGIEPEVPTNVIQAPMASAAVGQGQGMALVRLIIPRLRHRWFKIQPPQPSSGGVVRE
jgi:hypothetical protein